MWGSSSVPPKLSVSSSGGKRAYQPAGLLLSPSPPVAIRGQPMHGLPRTQVSSTCCIIPLPPYYTLCEPFLAHSAPSLPCTARGKGWRDGSGLLGAGQDRRPSYLWHAGAVRQAEACRGARCVPKVSTAQGWHDALHLTLPGVPWMCQGHPSQSFPPQKCPVQQKFLGSLGHIIC